MACHILPDSVRKGKLADADAVIFVRFDEVDTQYRMPSGVARDPRGDRQELTLGIGFYPTRNFVIKADYQIRRDATSDDPENLINLGLGFEF